MNGLVCIFSTLAVMVAMNCEFSNALLAVPRGSVLYGRNSLMQLKLRPRTGLATNIEAQVEQQKPAVETVIVAPSMVETKPTYERVNAINPVFKIFQHALRTRTGRQAFASDATIAPFVLHTNYNWRE